MSRLYKCLDSRHTGISCITNCYIDIISNKDIISKQKFPEILTCQ